MLFRSYENFSSCMVTLPLGQRIEKAISDFCADKTVSEVEALLNERGIPNQRAYGPGDILKDPHYKAREDIVTWTDSVLGEVTGIGIMNKFKRNPAKIVASAPTFGEHNVEVLRALGIPEETIDAMYEAGEFDGMDARETAIRWRMKEWGFFWNEKQSTMLDL